MLCFTGPVRELGHIEVCAWFSLLPQCTRPGHGRPPGGYEGESRQERGGWWSVGFGGPAVMGEAGSSRGSFPAWADKGPKRLAQHSSMRTGTKVREPDEDTRSWMGFERRRRLAVSQPKEPKTPKGPAFWNKAATPQKRKPRAQPAKGSRQRVPSVPSKTLSCVSPCFRRLVYLLVVFALILFFSMTILIGAYVMKTKKNDGFLFELGGQQRRLKEAVMSLARGHRMTCAPCQRNWMQMADTCYLFSDERMAWDSCIQHCSAQNASLYIAYTEAEMVSILLETRRRITAKGRRQLPMRYWIGLMYNHTAETWLWADGSHLHIKMLVTETSPPKDDICVTFYYGRQVLKPCNFPNHCLCKSPMPPPRHPPTPSHP